jgi:hypothetical protein
MKKLNYPSDGNYSKNGTTESSKETSRGRVRLFKINDKPVAYFIGTEGKMTKDDLTKDQVKLIQNFFAKSHITYTGKVKQEEIQNISD